MEMINEKKLFFGILMLLFIGFMVSIRVFFVLSNYFFRILRFVVIGVIFLLRFLFVSYLVRFVVFFLLIFNDICFVYFGFVKKGV